MEISPTLLGQWQNLAIEGMLKALDPTKKDPLPPLNHHALFQTPAQSNLHMDL
jgi:hypothetical protein